MTVISVIVGIRRQSTTGKFVVEDLLPARNIFL